MAGKKKTEESKPAMSVYSKLKSERYDGKFDKKNGKILRKHMVCTDSWVEAQGDAFKNSGIFYKKDEDATKRYLAGDKYK